ncbi:MAG: helix-turn-helix domain-containing protein, partial [Rubrobacteraceae bacterium]
MTREDKPPDIREDGPNIGPTLLEARTEKGLSLDDVEQATKIRKRYIEGLERDDYTVLPDAVYVQGFLKTYANYLGLD